MGGEYGLIQVIQEPHGVNTRALLGFVVISNGGSVQVFPCVDGGLQQHWFLAPCSHNFHGSKVQYLVANSTWDRREFTTFFEVVHYINLVEFPVNHCYLAGVALRLNKWTAGSSPTPGSPPGTTQWAARHKTAGIGFWES